MKLLSLAAILAHIWVRVACHKRKVADDKTMIEATFQKPRIAVMIVGKTLKVTPQGAQVSFSERSDNVKQLIEMMTGDEVEENATERKGEMSQWTSVTPVPPQPHWNPNVWTDVGDTNMWENTKSRLLAHLSRSAEVDTYICVNDAAGLSSDGEVTRIFEFVAKSQLDRAAQCVSKVGQTGQKYDWFIKTRPDFFLLRDWPDVTKFNPDYVYTRFRWVSGLKGLTTHDLSWNFCQKDNCAQQERHWYINDDMLLVASGKLIDHVYATKHPAPLPQVYFPNFDVPDDAEGNWTRHLLENHILTMPLTISGCPLASSDNLFQCSSSYQCRNSPFPVACANDSISFPQLHNLMRTSGNTRAYMRFKADAVNASLH